MAPKIIRNDEAVSSIPSPVDQSGIASISLSVCHLPFPSRPWSILEVSKGMCRGIRQLYIFGSRRYEEGRSELNNSSV